MIRYLLTAASFEGSITYGYNAAGYFCYFEVNATLTEVQYHGLLQHLGYALTKELFLEWSKKYKYKVTELEEDLSFDRFWNEYGTKRNRIEAEKIWDKLSKEEKQLVLQNLKAYNRYCHRNANWYNKLYPDTYLRKHWKDEWDKA